MILRSKSIYLFIYLFVFTLGVKAQNTNYTPLYTSYNFTKTIDVSKEIGVVQGTEAATASGGATYTIPIYM
jgi:hypothetical protein